MQVAIEGNQQLKLRVLLADTGTQLIRQLTAMLSQADWEVLSATDGFEVLCRLPELRPDVVVIAADLPRLSGIQVCSLLRQSPDFSALPVLVLAGQNPILDKVRAKMAGANACLEKPFRSEELKAAFAGLFQETGADGLPAHS
ncbi:MAG: response regulator [Pseudohongiella sp.]|nr:response regulator [Pseudohongiella sp.]MDP2126472.1 response regulator [Pseudohongiella sp.]